MSESQLPLFIKIKEFLSNNLGFNFYDKIKLENSSALAVNVQKPRNNSKGSVLFIVKNINILHNYLCPYLNNFEFITKKGKDFEDFKIKSRAIYYAAHKDEKIKYLILKLSHSMNNFRLSTYSGKIPAEFLSMHEKAKLINVTPQVEHLQDGRVKNIYLNKILHQHESSIYKILKPSGEIVITQTITEAAKIVGVNIKTLSKKLDRKMLQSAEYTANINNIKIKRIGVFYK